MDDTQDMNADRLRDSTKALPSAAAVGVGTLGVMAAGAICVGLWFDANRITADPQPAPTNHAITMTTSGPGASLPVIDHNPPVAPTTDEPPTESALTSEPLPTEPESEELEPPVEDVVEPAEPEIVTPQWQPAPPPQPSVEQPQPAPPLRPAQPTPSTPPTPEVVPSVTTNPTPPPTTDSTEETSPEIRPDFEVEDPNNLRHDNPWPAPGDIALPAPPRR